MNVRRKLIDALAPQEVKDMLKFLDGKKTLLGVIVAELPNIIASVQHIWSATGASTDDYVKVTGAILAGVGLIHKFLKD